MKVVRPADDSHFFVTTLDRKRNRYGWVSGVEPFTLADLIEEDQASRAPELERLPDEWLLAYLEGVQRQPVGTPMSCSFLRQRLPGRERTSLRVHKVLFYDAGP